jgi:hypothetical protein
MNITKSIFTIIIIVVFVNLGYDFLKLTGIVPTYEGLENVKESNSKDKKSHNYAKYFSGKEEIPLHRKTYEKIGYNFIADQSKSKNISTPHIQLHDAEILGKMVSRVYNAKIEQLQTNSSKTNDEVLAREIQLLNKVSAILKSEGKHTEGKHTEGKHTEGKKQNSIANQASEVTSCGSKLYRGTRTTGLNGYTPQPSNNIKREEGSKLVGSSIYGSHIYHDLTNATHRCYQEDNCAGVNFDSTRGTYRLISKPAHLERNNKTGHFTAFIKKKHKPKHNPKHNPKHKSNKKGQVDDEDTYQPITGIGFGGNQCVNGKIRNVNLMPRPYNSLMNVF